MPLLLHAFWQQQGGREYFYLGTYRKVRFFFREGMSEPAAPRRFGISREIVNEMMLFSVPPGCRRTAVAKLAKLDGFTEIIKQSLRDDLGQRRTSSRS